MCQYAVKETCYVDLHIYACIIQLHSHTDIISSLKSGDSPAGNGGSVNTSLSPNDLSNSISSVVSVGGRLRVEEPEIFSRLPPDQYGPKGMIHVDILHAKVSFMRAHGTLAPSLNESLSLRESLKYNNFLN